MIQRIIAVSVPREHTEVVVRLILDKRIVPSVSDHDTFKTYVVCTLDILIILFLKVLVENWTVVTTVRLGGEVHPFPGVLRECTHEALECLPHVRRGCRRRVRGQTLVEVAVSAAVPVTRILGAGVVGQLDEISRNRIGVCGHGRRVAEAHLSRLVNEDDVADFRP